MLTSRAPETRPLRTTTPGRRAPAAAPGPPPEARRASNIHPQGLHIIKTPASTASTPPAWAHHARRRARKPASRRRRPSHPWRSKAAAAAAGIATRRPQRGSGRHSVPEPPTLPLAFPFTLARLLALCEGRRAGEPRWRPVSDGGCRRQAGGDVCAGGWLALPACCAQALADANEEAGWVAQPDAVAEGLAKLIQRILGLHNRRDADKRSIDI
jgi:hypothetical protein